MRDDPVTKTSLLASARDVAFIAAIYLFFAGYVFRSQYYLQFGLPTIGSASGNPMFFIYSYEVLVDDYIPALLFVAVAAILYVSMLKAPWLQRDEVRRAYAALLALAAFPLLAYMAHVAALKESSAYRNGNSADGTVTLGIREMAKTHDFSTLQGIKFLSTIDQHELRILAISDDAYFLSHGSGSNFIIYAVPRDEVSHLDINLPVDPSSVKKGTR